jgi:sorbitol-specific phosphotransferase system component IIC
MTANAMTMRYRLAIASRVTAAILGGYALAAAMAMALARALPMTREEATTAATILGVLSLPAAAIWAFAARSAWQAWAGIAAATAVAGLSAWLLGASA